MEVDAAVPGSIDCVGGYEKAEGDGNDEVYVARRRPSYRRVYFVKLQM